MRAASSTQAFSITAVLIATFVLLLSCTAGGSKDLPVQHFSLSIAFSEPLGDSGAPLPDDIKALLKPIQPKNCSSFLFVPDASFVRLDLLDVKPETLDLGKDQNEVERRLGKALAPEKARTVREKGLAAQKISTLMSQAKGSDNTTAENLRKLLATAGNQYVFTTDATKRALGTTLSINKLIIARDLGDLIAKMGLAFCAKSGDKPAPMASLIVYRPGEVVTETPPASSNSPSPTNVSIGTPPTPGTSKEDADALLNQLSAEAQQAAVNSEKRQAVQAKLAKAQAEFTWDYRFSYERAKLAVYGKAHHDEAFYHLFRAAEIAIKNGDADRMIQALQNDGSGVFHPLTDHSEWQTINNALKTKNSEMVRK
jgi:hypothetical protein